MSLKIGDTAPPFTLKSSDKTDVSLSDYNGKNVVVLFFHWHLQVYVLRSCALLETISQITKILMLKYWQYLWIHCLHWPNLKK